MAARVEEQSTTNLSDYDYSNFYYSSGDDIFAILDPFNQWYQVARPQGYYLYGQPMATPPQARVDVEEQLGNTGVNLLNLSSYNYLGLSYRPEVIAAAKAEHRERSGGTYVCPLPEDAVPPIGMSLAV